MVHAASAVVQAGVGDQFSGAVGNSGTAAHYSSMVYGICMHTLYARYKNWLVQHDSCKTQHYCMCRVCVQFDETYFFKLLVQLLLAGCVIS